jgi:transposase
MGTEYIGIDLHKAFFHACAVDEVGERVWETRWPTTAAGIRALLARCGAESHVVIEASGPTWCFADQIVDHVADVQVIDARKTRLRAGYAAKTDRLDARRLADARRRDSVVAVYYPPRAIRQLRELCRYRAVLVRLRRALKHRLHALLLRQGVATPRCADLFGVRGSAWLATVSLEAWAGESFRGLSALYHTIDAQLAAVDAVVQREAQRDPVARALDQIPGIGAVLGLMIRAEVGSITRFARPAQLASYAGLVPRVSQSGSRCYHGPITKQGSPWLRWALIEAALCGSRRPDPVGHWARQLALRKGALKARAALARRLCADVLRTWARVDSLSDASVETSLATSRVAAR